MARMLDDLVRLAAAGGGFTLDARSKTVDQIVRIAAAARTHGARITMKNAENRTTDELVRIAAAGQGAVAFDFTE